MFIAIECVYTAPLWSVLQVQMSQEAQPRQECHDALHNKLHHEVRRACGKVSGDHAESHSPGERMVLYLLQSWVDIARMQGCQM